MRILLLTIGSFGDVNPFIGLGLALQKRGHEVMVIANTYFEPMLKKVGLAFTSSAPSHAHLGAVHNPAAGHPDKGPDQFRRSCLAAIPETFSSIKWLHQPGNTIMAAAPQAFAARIAQESLGIPLATVIPYPMLFRSIYDAAGPTSNGFLSSLRRWRWRMRFHCHDFVSDKLFAPQINSFRVKLGLAPVRRVWSRWLNSPQRVIGLWPEWLYSPKPDWPPQAVLTGFIEYDGAPTVTTLDPWECATGGRSGSPAPIVFTAGTACFDAPEFFAAACETCEILNWPGVLLTQQEKHLRKPLPRIVRHIRYAPLGELLPRAAAIVHHGGIGTSARALKAGIPQLVMPMAYDQHDNAHRLGHLGVAKSIERKHFTAQNVASELRQLLESQTVLERCRHYARKFEGGTALESTCDYIEALM
jgi:rhamnosyltransferase subunit B